MSIRFRNFLTVLGLAGCLFQVQIGPLRGQEAYPRSRVGRFEVDGFDFRPEGAWRKGSERVRSNRAGLLGLRALSVLNGRSAMTRVAGTYFVPVVPITFNNTPAPFPAAQYENVLFNPSPTTEPYSVRSYYREMSRGAVTISGVALDWVVADSADVYYEDGCNGVGVKVSCPHGGRPFVELLLEALKANDTGAVDWGEFDNDGPDGIPNSGDDDGFVDFVTFLQPKVDGACGEPGIWAHRFFISAWTGKPYQTKSPRRGAGGVILPGQFISVEDYTMQSAVGGTTACDGSAIMPVGTVAHETGHAFGLPDLYDTDLRSPSVTQGIGEWGIMGSGNYTQPYSPSRFEAWSLAQLGWVAIDTLGTSRSVRLSPVATSDTVLYIAVPNTDEYFLVENRQPIGSDSAQINDACVFGTRSCAKGPGLLVWHIDQGIVAARGFRLGNRVNTGSIQGVALVQADGLNQLREPGGKNRGDPGDAFPGSTENHTLGDLTVPAALDNQGATAGFGLDSIYQDSDGSVAFRFIKTTAGLVNVSLPQAIDEILGKGSLGSSQLAYLDSLGNKNGGYDVGDFLSYLSANSSAVSPEVLRAVLAADRRRHR
ncbi:MAG TPA: M6 family metalloprotease domain-containing protein [Gemmatimonadales bacterium]|nr:M6 family metalloprotease domain-containing protein [Gemmatimonadales bacterium]